MRFTNLQESVLNRVVKKIKRYMKMIVVSSDRITAESIKLRTAYKLVSRTAKDRRVVAVAQRITASAQVRLKSINHQLADLNDQNHKVNLTIKSIPLSGPERRRQLPKAVFKIKQLELPIKRKVSIIKRRLARNQLALTKMHHLQQLLNLSKHELGCIEIFYIDAHNHVIQRQTELGHRDQSFDLIHHLTEVPRRYHFVRVITGKHQMFYRAYVQRAMIEVAKNPSAALSVARQKPKVEVDDQQPCRIQLIYLNLQGKVVQIHDSIGTKGAPFVLRQAIHLPADCQLVKIISGSNVKRYRQREQLIELVIRSNESISKPQVNRDQVRQAFLDYYNAQIMGMTLHGTDYSTRFGYRCAKQYLMGVADAYQEHKLRMKTQLYRRGYQVYRNAIAQRQIHLNSLTDVFLKISRVIIQDAALLDHDLKRRL